jgi:hypothetical protein
MSSTANQEKREKWKALVDEQEQSGLSQEAFCKSHNISPSNFIYYRGIFRGKQQNKSSIFSPVNITKAPGGINEIRLTLPNGFQCAFPTDLEIPRVKELIGALLSC